MAQRVVVAMSGGVDSSVAACLLKEQGFDVVGLFMRTGTEAQDAVRQAKTCCSVADAADAERVADRLDIPFYVLDFEREFGQIKDYFADEYMAGRTPNPCVMCNIWLKFGKLWAYGKQVGADFVATGHYARISRAADGTLTSCPRTRPVQRSVVRTLRASQRALTSCAFSRSGSTPKPRSGRLARHHDLPVHDKPESQDICFVPDDDYLAFVRHRRPGLDTSGPIVDEAGTPLGGHAGIEGFTIGQRRGLGLAVGAPRYVVQIEPVSRTVTIGPRQSLEHAGLEATRFNWQGAEPDGPAPCLAQIRARHRRRCRHRRSQAGTPGAPLVRYPADGCHAGTGGHALPG